MKKDIIKIVKPNKQISKMFTTAKVFEQGISFITLIQVPKEKYNIPNGIKILNIKEKDLETFKSFYDIILKDPERYYTIGSIDNKFKTKELAEKYVDDLISKIREKEA
jgi:hypothetical protein